MRISFDLDDTLICYAAGTPCEANAPHSEHVSEVFDKLEDHSVLQTKQLPMDETLLVTASRSRRQNRRTEAQ